MIEMGTSTFKTSIVFVGTSRKTRVFRSLDEVPAGVRKRLQDNLAGPNTRTLVVADRAGREYLLRALRHATGSSAPLGRRAAARTRREARNACGAARRYWLEIVLIGLLGVATWALFYTR
jgi:hypothetical protein